MSTAKRSVSPDTVRRWMKDSYGVLLDEDTAAALASQLESVRDGMAELEKLLREDTGGGSEGRAG